MAGVKLSLKSWAIKFPLAGFFFSAYLLSLLIGIPLAVTSKWDQQPLPFSIHYLVAYGPALSGILITYLSSGRAGLKELFNRLTKWRVGFVWWLAALSPLWILAVVYAWEGAMIGEWGDLGLLGQVNFLPNLGCGALPLWIFTFGIGEEIGWRGYALPRLQKNRNALSATLILSFLGALWHGIFKTANLSSKEKHVLNENDPWNFDPVPLRLLIP